jgi:acyl carrier protein phosphodiesterase
MIIWQKTGTTILKFSSNLCRNFYHLLQANIDILTDKVKNMLPSMIGRNWLVSYATIKGLEMILFQMDYRTKNRAAMLNQWLSFKNIT